MRLSLQTKIISAVVVLVAAGGGLTAYLVYKNSSAALKSSISANLSDSTDQSMDKIDRFLYERLVDVQQVAGREQIQNYLTQPATRTPAESTVLIKQLNDFKVLVGVWNDMSLLDTKGNIALTTDSPQLAAALKDQAAFIKAYKSAVAGQASYSDVILESGKYDPIMLFMSPVRDLNATGQPIAGVMVGELEWVSALENLRGFDNVSATLVNSQGQFIGNDQLDASHNILARNLSSNAAVKVSQQKSNDVRVLPGIDNKNNEYLTASTHEKGYLDYAGNNWLAIFQTPRKLAFQPAEDLAKKLAIIFFGVLIISVSLFVVIFNRQVIKPLLKLKKASLLIAAGDFTQTIANNSKDEIGQLTDAFNNMTMGLQSSSVRLSEEHARLEASINSLGVGFLMTFLGTETISYNPALIKILGLKDWAKTAGHERLSIAILQQKIEDFNLAQAIHGAQTEGEHFSIIKTTSDERIISISGAPIASADKRILGSVVLVEDITEAKVQERSRDEFFSIASHELRTPLTSIKGNAAMIMDYYAESIKDPELKEMIGDIRLSSERLIEIVNDFLDISRLEQGKIIFNNEEFSIEPVVENVIYEMKAALAQKHLHLTFDKMTLNTLPKVWADKNRTKQVVYNLVGNASKFTDSGNINVSATVDQEMIKVLVTDTGRGMSLESQKLLFHKFQQAGSSILTRDTTRGTGLGLYISKMLVEGMGGQIALEYSEAGKGSSFSFSLPIATDEVKLAHPIATRTRTDIKTGLSVLNDQKSGPSNSPPEDKGQKIPT